VRIGAPEISQLSFPDEEVIAWAIDRHGKRFSVTTTGAHYGPAGVVRTFVTVTLGPWTSFRGTRFPVGREPQAIAQATEPLKDIGECAFADGTARIAGFGAISGDWMQYEFDAQAIVAEWDA